MGFTESLNRAVETAKGMPASLEDSYDVEVGSLVVYKKNRDGNGRTVMFEHSGVTYQNTNYGTVALIQGVMLNAQATLADAALSRKVQ